MIAYVHEVVSINIALLMSVFRIPVFTFMDDKCSPKDRQLACLVKCGSLWMFYSYINLSLPSITSPEITQVADM